MNKDKAHLRAEAYAALEALKELVFQTRIDAMFNDEGVSDKFIAYADGSNTISGNHYMLALSALENATLHLSSAMLTLGD